MKNDGEGIDEIPVVQYFVMGDPDDPDTSGNVWKTADDWPVPARTTPVYFIKDGSLQLEPSEETNASLSYKYDPENPVPTIGGANLVISSGPMDQQTLEVRPDVLVKGEDWAEDAIIGAAEVKSRGGRIERISFVEDGSTTGIIETILQQHKGDDCDDSG